jgi:hypothetical protein
MKTYLNPTNSISKYKGEYGGIFVFTSAPYPTKEGKIIIAFSPVFNFLTPSSKPSTVPFVPNVSSKSPSSNFESQILVPSVLDLRKSYNKRPV